MEKDFISLIVEKNLKIFGITHIISKSTQEQLIRIEQYFLECERELEIFLNKIKNINYTVRGISRGTGIGKSTVYNSPTILKVYIEKRQEQIEKKDYISENRVEKLLEMNKELKSQIEKSKINIINAHLLENEVSSLKKENIKLEKKVNTLSAERFHMVKLLDDLEKQLYELRKKEGNIVKLKNK